LTSLLIDNKNTERFLNDRIDEFFYEWYNQLNYKKIEQLETQILLYKTYENDYEIQKHKNEKLSELISLIEDEKHSLFLGLENIYLKVKTLKNNIMFENNLFK